MEKSRLRVYHFLRADHGLCDLRHRRLKVAEIDKLNDPFEFLGAASRDANVRRHYRELKAGLAKFMGLLCFSKNWQNPVQWSHYAEHHRGLCLGFDVSSAADIRKVNYVGQRLKPRTMALRKEGNAANEHMTEILTSKFRHWEYEEEYRLFVHLEERDQCTGFYWHDFSPHLNLRKVIIGACSNVTRQSIQDALQGDDRKAQISNARLGFQKFEVVTQKSPKLWT